MNLIQPPTPEISDDGKTKEKVMVLIGIIALVAAGFYFVIRNVIPRTDRAPKDEVKLIDQSINVIEGSVDSVNLGDKTFVLSAGKAHTIATFPETTWMGIKSVADLKQGMRVKVNYIDAQRETNLLYAASVEKLK